MKKHFLKPLLSLMLGLIIFTSCQEEEIDSIFFRTDGGLSTVLKDAEGQAIAEAKVSLYNMRTQNRIDVGYSNENGVVDFGRFEAGEYSISYEFHHNDEFFQIFEEVHIISGTDKQHEINTADHYGDLLVRIFDNSTGELIEFDTETMIGLIPRDEAYEELTGSADIRSLVEYSFDTEGQLSITDIPEASYVVLMYNEDNIFYSNSMNVNPFDKSFVNIGVNPLSILLSSKSTWVVSNVTADSNADNVLPINSISFEGTQDMLLTYENGETDEGYMNMYSSGRFDWYNLGSNSYGFNYDEDTYQINSDGSITFHFNYWETYNYSTGDGYYSNNVSLTLI